MQDTLIIKEEIGNYHLVPAMEDKSAYWEIALSYAVRLGNEFKGKTTVTFETSKGSRTVETTIWSITSQYIQLKGGTTIPLKSITSIHF